MKQWKKLIGIFMSGAVLITGCASPQKNAATVSPQNNTATESPQENTAAESPQKTAAAVEGYGISSPRTENGVTTWDKIKFGNYYQDAGLQPAEPIKWRVLWVDEEDNDAFLIADQILDAKPYNEEDEDVTWENCTLRKWLNNDFYNEAFNDEEKKAIKETTVVNEDNPECGTEGGRNTKDKVYLLSIAEASDLAYGFDTESEFFSETGQAKPTDYAKVNNVWSSIDNGKPNSVWIRKHYGTPVYGYWWLRSPGAHSNTAADIAYSGRSDFDGYPVEYGELGVRPVLHINLSSSEVTHAGKVDSKGKITKINKKNNKKIHNPVVEDRVTTWDCVYFGNYRQNCTFEKQDIEWRVLSVNDDDAFLVADRILDCKQYNEEPEDITWETCTLRKWLNDDFYNEAFDDEEKKAVKETTAVNENHPYYYGEGGNNTTDKVYLLSIAESENAAYGFDTKYDADSKTRQAESTDYAKVNNVYGSRNGIGSWWQRSPGNINYNAAYVNEAGCGDITGCYVNYSEYGVRPALHINLSSPTWSKAGEVTAVQNSDEKPTESPEPTEVPVSKATDIENIYGLSGAEGL